MYLNTDEGCWFSPFLGFLLLSYFFKLFSPFCHMTTFFIILLQWRIDNINTLRITIMLSHLRHLSDAAVWAALIRADWSHIYPAQHFVLDPCIRTGLCWQWLGSPETLGTKCIHLALLSNRIFWFCSHAMNLTVRELKQRWRLKIIAGKESKLSRDIARHRLKWE